MDVNVSMARTATPAPAPASGPAERALIMASELAAARQGASLAAMPWGDITTADLYSMHSRGVIDTQFLDKALNYMTTNAGSNRAELAPPTITSAPDGTNSLDGYI